MNLRVMNSIIYKKIVIGVLNAFFDI